MGPYGAKNQKMVLTNVAQDAILYFKMNCQHMLQKFPYPTAHRPELETLVLNKGGFFSKVNEFEFPAKIKSQIVKNWRILEKKI